MPRRQAWLRLLPHLEAQQPNILFTQTTKTPVIALAEHSMACDLILHGLAEPLAPAPLSQSPPSERWQEGEVARWMGWPSWRGWGCSRCHSILKGSESLPYGSRRWVAILVMIAMMVWLGGWAGPAGEAGAVLVRAALVAVAQPLDDLLHRRLREDAHSPALQPLQLVKGRQDAARQSVRMSHSLYTLIASRPGMSHRLASVNQPTLCHCSRSSQ